MRLKVKVLEGGETRTHLVPLATVLAYRQEHGETINETIQKDQAAGVDNSVEWGAWVAWHADTRSDGRDLLDWTEAVDWIGIEQAPDELDPSGGEENPTGDASPASSSRAPSKRSSSSTKTSKRPSGPRSAAR